MKTKIKEAAASIEAKRSAKQIKQRYKSYLEDVSMSSLKIRLGEILLYLQRPMGQNQRSGLQRSFEIMLRRYLDLKHSTSQWPYQSSHDGCNGRFNGVESTKCINKGNE